MLGLRSAAFLLLIGTVFSKQSSIEVSILRYKGLQAGEIENLEHLSYTFDICLCRSHFKGLFPNRSPLCECAPQLRGRRVRESLPEGVYSASCVYKNSPGKCLNVKFTGEELGRKIMIKAMIGKSIYTYPTWQNLVFSPYRTTSTLKSAAGSDMRISYTTMHRSIDKEHHPSPTSQATTTSAPKTTQKSIDVEKKDMLDLIREDFRRGKSWMMKPITWLTNIFSSKPDTFSSFTPSETTKTTKSWTTTTPRTTTTSVTTTAPRRTPTNSNRWDLSDVAHIRNVNDVRLFMVKEAAVDRADPARYDIPTVKDELLFYHNVYREMHEAPEVKRSAYLEGLAQRYSDHLAFSKSCLVHEQPRIYGENLFVFGSQTFPDPSTFAKAVAQSFYMEVNEYSYNSFVPFGYYKTGHFTQLVWKESHHIGVGVTVVKTDGYGRGLCFPRGPAYMIYVCVKYDPAGNYQTSEAYKRNVRPLKRRRVL